ncbi:MAG: two-component sensor histidine kinase, partial [Duncaniella sp.]|nr:two-component sensor histidine kinase [Duncaniella sp.]
MKKSTIWFLTIIMALTFAGLLYVQITYMSNMKKMRDDQFEEGVKRSLYAVTTRLEQDEAKHFLEEDLSSIDVTSMARNGKDASLGITNKFSTPEGINYDLTLSMNVDRRAITPSMRELLRGKYLYQKGLLDEVILNIINQSSSRPIVERADSAEVRRYLRSELDNNGLNLPFEFAVVNRVGAYLYHSPWFYPSSPKGTD